MFWRESYLLGIVILSLAFVAASADAALLPPDSEVTPTALSGPVGGTLIANHSTSFTSTPLGTFSGSLVGQVWSDDPDNPDGLTFTYQLTSDASSVNSIGRIVVSMFDTWIVDVAYFVQSGERAPATADRGFSGDPIGFNFQQPTGKIGPGETTALLVLRTNAPALTVGMASLINSDTATIETFAPVPEPAGTLALVALGGTALLRRRRA